MKTKFLTLLFAAITSFTVAQVDFRSGKGVPYIDFPDKMIVGDFDGNGQDDVIFTAWPSFIIAYYSVGDEMVQKKLNTSNLIPGFYLVVLNDITLKLVKQ